MPPAYRSAMRPSSLLPVPDLPRPPALRAILLDVDGTLYRQAPVRRTMLRRLVAAHALRPRLGWRTFRALGAYRRAQEVIRHAATGTVTTGTGMPTAGGVAARQLRWAAERAGVTEAEVQALVEAWMERSPLDLLLSAARPGLAPFVRAARRHGVRLAVVSDYPAAAKLAALGIADGIACTVCAQDDAVDAFKPDPRGILVALDRLGVPAGAALYVGDRPEVDAVAARCAGVTCCIVGAARPGPAPARYVRDFGELRRLLFGETAP